MFRSSGLMFQRTRPAQQRRGGARAWHALRPLHVTTELFPESEGSDPSRVTDHVRDDGPVRLWISATRSTARVALPVRRTRPREDRIRGRRSPRSRPSRLPGGRSTPSAATAASAPARAPSIWRRAPEGRGILCAAGRHRRRPHRGYARGARPGRPGVAPDGCAERSCAAPPQRSASRRPSTVDADRDAEIHRVPNPGERSDCSNVMDRDVAWWTTQSLIHTAGRQPCTPGTRGVAFEASPLFDPPHEDFPTSRSSTCRVRSRLIRQLHGRRPSRADPHADAAVTVVADADLDPRRIEIPPHGRGWSRPVILSRWWHEAVQIGDVAAQASTVPLICGRLQPGVGVAQCDVGDEALRSARTEQVGTADPGPRSWRP